MRLTAEGLTVIDAAMTQHTTAEHALVDALTVEELAQLQSLLRKLLVAVEPT